MELMLHDNQEIVRELMEKFIKENSTIIYDTSNQKSQQHYPLNNMIEKYLSDNGLNDYRVYGVCNKNWRFSTNNMEILDNENKFTGIYLKYSKKVLEDLSTLRDDDYFGKVKVGKYKMQFKIKMYQECLVLS